MPSHRCNYCLKPIPTEPGIKRHIAQLPACHKQWTKLLEQTEFTGSNHEDDQLLEQANDNVPYESVNVFDSIDGPDNFLDIPDGHLVHHSPVNVDPGPPELCKPPPKRARMEEDNGNSPAWPSSGRFTEWYPGVTTIVLGKNKTVFESMEAAEFETGESEWAPFHDKDEWELAWFLMKNLGQMEIDELLKLSHVSD